MALRLMTMDGIRKPSWFAYKYLNGLLAHDLPCTDAATWASCDGQGSLRAVIWDQRPVSMGKITNRTFFGRPQPVAAPDKLPILLSNLRPGPYRVRVRRTGYQANDAYTAWMLMGKPDHLTTAQAQRLQALTTDKANESRIVVGADGTTQLTLGLRAHDVLALEVLRD